MTVDRDAFSARRRPATRVVVVDDDGDLRSLVRVALERQPALEVVAEVGTCADALSAVAACQPDVVVLDLSLPDISGHEVLPAIHQRCATCRVVVFTGSDAITVEDVVGAGASDLVPKDGDVRRLVEVVLGIADRAGMAATIVLDGSPASAREARDFLAELCIEWDCGADVTGSAVLLVSELVTNAVVHARSAPELRVRLTDDVLRVEVLDGGGGVPDPQAPSTTSEHGRGMQLVSALAAAWGVDPIDDGKLVWAELAR